MNILFVHQNFPGQFKFLAAALAAMPGHTVLAMHMQRTTQRQWRGVHLVPYAADRGSSPGIHPWVGDLETKVIRGEACFRAALALRSQGFTPDVVIAHPGWGESLFLKDVWPRTRLGVYCEFYYRSEGADVGFDPEFAPATPETACQLRLKNSYNLIQFETATAGISPTLWQAGTYPERLRQRISVVHDGIDTDTLAPGPGAGLEVAPGLRLGADDEIVTFVSRNLEPYRGYHIFMRALPELLRRRPKARVLLVGADGVSYGRRPPDGRSWKQVFIDEVRAAIPDPDWDRVHFLGRLPYPRFLDLLRLATVHVYLTYPFVLSWSLLEAMSLGRAIVASDTAPLREVVVPGETGQLVDFFDPSGLAAAIDALLDDPDRRRRLGANARALARERYDLRSVCLPRQLAWVAALRDGRAEPATGRI